MQKILYLLLLMFVANLVLAQNQPPYTSATERIQSFEQRKALEQASIINGVALRNVGPTIMSGRVTDLDVSPSDPTHFYVAYASGGLWKTVNNGQSFEPLFDNEMIMTIGDIAVDWSRNTIWVGSGEVNSSRSSYSGAGVFKSTNGGKTWQHMGLGESHHIGRIILHPTDPNTAWVAALGHLYSPNKDRGIYKTTDGGKTWKHTLAVNDNTGAVDIVPEPGNPKVLYASTWHRERRAWNFVEGGEGTGIYKSTDGGESWTRVTNEKSGFPVSTNAGRIGLAIHKSGRNTTLYATIDNYDRRPVEESEEDVLTTAMVKKMTADEFLKKPKYQIDEYLQSLRLPREYNTNRVTAMLKKGDITLQDLIKHTEDPFSENFEASVIGSEVYKSNDGGKTWKRTHEDFLDVYSSFGYYFGMIHVAPYDVNKIYIYGVPIIRSDDGGKTWESIGGSNVHSDHHALWVNPNRPGHLINGNDGGVNISYDDGATWIKCNTPAVGQFYSVTVDDAKPYNVYGGLQDNGVWMGPSTYQASNGWQGNGEYDYKRLGGGDGMMVQVDTRDNATVYLGSQFGNYSRVNSKTGERKRITPSHDFGESPLRWNWESPIYLSRHNQDILYMASNKLHRSFNQGDDFAVISDDLTKGGKMGDVTFGTLSTIHESPLRFGLIYTGSDDGLVHVTPDGGNTWNNISAGLPQDMWVSQVFASAHDEGTVYVSLNGYRWDNFTPYVYMSTDFGKNWTRIGNDLPLEPVNVIKEDPSNADILYVGTDHGLYVSLNKGKDFMLWNNGLPAVAVHDLEVQARDKDLVVGTHGRSIYIGNIEEIQKLDEETRNKALVAWAPEKQRYNARWGFTRQFSDFSFKPEVALPLYVKNAGQVTVTVKDEAGTVMKTFTADVVKGLNYPSYDLTFNADLAAAVEEKANKNRKPDEKPIKITKADDGNFYLYVGNYTITLEKDGASQDVKLIIEAGRGGGGGGFFGEPGESEKK